MTENNVIHFRKQPTTEDKLKNSKTKITLVIASIFIGIGLLCTLLVLKHQGLESVGLRATRTSTFLPSTTSLVTSTITSTTSSAVPSTITPTLTSTFTATIAPNLSYTPGPTHDPINPGTVEVHFIDVGYGDAILIQIGETCSVLIDGGYISAGIDLVCYLHSIGVEKLDMVVASHPHADHIGGLIPVLQLFPVDWVVTNGATHTTPIYEQFLDAIVTSGAEYIEVARGDSLHCGGLILEILHPIKLTGHINNDSLVVRLVHGEVIFLFTGDIYVQAETSLVESGEDISTTILKVAHHGSRSSSTGAFLEKARPEIAVYSVSLDNEYGYPAREVLMALEGVGAKVYGTDIYGTVVVTSDGYGYTIHVAKDNQLEAPQTGTVP